jgi:hypothetical protein
VLGDPANNMLPTHQENDEVIWNNLLMAIRNAYFKYHGAKGAYRAIKDLQQKEGHVDDYIVEFETLLSKVEWGWDQHGTIATFKEGLIEGLLRACIRHHPCPVTLTDWEDAARDKKQSFYQLKFDLAEAKKHRSGRHLGDMAWDASKSKKPAYDTDPYPYVPMQLDAAKTQTLDLSKHLKKMVDDERAPYGCDEASQRWAMSVMIEGDPQLSNSIVLEFYWGAQGCDKVK